MRRLVSSSAFNPGNGPYGFETPDPPKKKRIFRWVFLGIQVLFLIWVISGIAGAGGTPTDCGSLDDQTCNDAESIGTGIGVAIVIFFWAIVDIILALTYLIFRKK